MNRLGIRRQSETAGRAEEGEWGYTLLVIVDVNGEGELGWIRGYEW